MGPATPDAFVKRVIVTGRNSAEVEMDDGTILLFVNGVAAVKITASKEIHVNPEIADSALEKAKEFIIEKTGVKMAWSFYMDFKTTAGSSGVYGDLKFR